MKIIVTGSLGHIGKPLTKILVQNGHAVTVISSKAEKQKDIEALGATAAIGQLEDKAFLNTVFSGADAVFAMEPPNYAAPDMVAYYRSTGDNYAQAVKETGVKRVVHLSSFGAHLEKGTGPIVGSYEVEKILNALDGVSVTHLRPAYFYYNLLNFIDMIKSAGFIGTNYGGDDLLLMVAPEDIAVAAAEELVKPEGEQVRYVASDDLTGNEAARILGEAIGKPDLKWMVFSDEQTKEAMLKNGMPEALENNFIEMGTSTHNGALREDYDRQKPISMGHLKLKDYAKEFAAAYNK